MLHFVTDCCYIASVLLLGNLPMWSIGGSLQLSKTVVLALQNCKVNLYGVPELKNPVRVAVHIRITYTPPVAPARPLKNS
jgi:hypothetical protein